MSLAHKEAGEAKAARVTVDRELQDASTELSRAIDASKTLKVKLGERKQAAAAMAAALATELSLPAEVQSALEAQDVSRLPDTLAKLSALVRLHLLQLC